MSDLDVNQLVLLRAKNNRDDRIEAITIAEDPLRQRLEVVLLGDALPFKKGERYTVNKMGHVLECPEPGHCELHALDVVHVCWYANEEAKQARAESYAAAPLLTPSDVRDRLAPVMEAVEAQVL